MLSYASVSVNLLVFELPSMLLFLSSTQKEYPFFCVEVLCGLSILALVISFLTFLMFYGIGYEVLPWPGLG